LIFFGACKLNLYLLVGTKGETIMREPAIEVLGFVVLAVRLCGSWFWQNQT